jgi:BirA family biotin operon repressor/biotin-[acetyl-CoA-carboxylase] ligase
MNGGVESPPAAGERSSRLGTPRVHRRVTGSTSADARALAGAGAPHGTLVTAAAQHEGRGRQGRSWHAPPGRALLCSLLLRDPPELLPIAAAVAVAELAGPQAVLKWPNDVQLGGRKVAGILIEGRPQEDWAVLGIGINVAVEVAELPPELRESAGTLGLRGDAVEPVLERLLVALEDWLARPGAQIVDAWRERDALLGQPIEWSGGRGVARGIDERGHLRVLREDGRHELLRAGEVHLAAP